MNARPDYSTLGKTCPVDQTSTEWARKWGVCNQRPCWCSQALVAGCTCGLYLDQERRRSEPHSTDCKTQEQK